MSGIEIAPIILRTLPALFQAANAVLPLVQGGKDWWTFEIAYKRFIGDIRTERITYEQNLKIFLGPLEMYLEESTSWYKDANAPLWHDSVMQDRIKRRIGFEEYDWFLDKLRCMDATVKLLHDMLPKQNGKLQALESGTLAYEINRFKNSFSVDKQPLMDTLKSVNSDINRFVLNLDRIENLQNKTISKHPPLSKHVQMYRTLQKQTKAIFTALQTHIKCGDDHAHHCGVMTDWSHHQSSLEPPSVVLLLSGHDQWRKMTCSLYSGGWKTSENSEPREDVNEIDQYDIQLRSQEWRASLVKAAAARKIGIAAVSATAAILNPNQSETETLWLEREIKKLKKTAGRQEAESDVPRKLSIRRAVTKVRQRFPKSGPDIASTECENAGGSSLLDIESTENRKTAQVTERKKKNPVRFEQQRFPRASIETNEIGLNQIDDICAFLSPDYFQSHKEHLNLDVGTIIFDLVTLGRDSHNVSSTMSLEDVFARLKGLNDRIKIGIELVRTIIGFADSGWVTQDWGRRSFSILASDSEDEKAYNTCIPRITSSFTPPRKFSIEQTRALLFSLGTILIELHDAKSLEKTKEWETYAANGLSIQSRLRFVASDRFHKMHSRHGDSLSEPIRRCLNYGFMKSTHIGDAELLAEVVSGVLVPLQGFINTWAQGPSG